MTAPDRKRHRNHRCQQLRHRQRDEGRQRQRSPLGEVTYTYTYTNTSLTTASGNLVITDPLPSTYVDYKSGSAKWNGVGVANAVDTLVPNTSGIRLALTPVVVGAAGTFSNVTNMVVTIGSVPAGATGTFTFTVRATAAAVPGTRVTNTASYQYNDKTVAGSTVPVVPATTSDFFDVTRTYGVTLVAQAPATIAAANAGTQVAFTDQVTNTGNMADTFAMDVASQNFPAGTTFQFYNTNIPAGFIPANRSAPPRRWLRSARTMSLSSQLCRPMPRTPAHPLPSPPGRSPRETTPTRPRLSIP